MVERGRPQKPRIEAEKVVAQRGRPRKPKPDLEINVKTEKQKTPSLYKEDPKAYFRAYYHNRPKVESTCEHCGNKFDSMLSLRTHIRTSVLCKKLRGIHTLNDID